MTVLVLLTEEATRDRALYSARDNHQVVLTTSVNAHHLAGEQGNMTGEVLGAKSNEPDSARIIARNELGVEDTEFREIDRRTRKQRAIRLLSRAVLIAGLFVGSFAVGYLLAKRNDPSNQSGYPLMVMAAAPIAARGVRRPSPMWWVSILVVLIGFLTGFMSYVPGAAPDEYGSVTAYSVVSKDDLSACIRRV